MQIESLDTVYNNLHCRFPLSPRGVCLPCPFLSCDPSFLFWLLSVQSSPRKQCTGILVISCPVGCPPC